jgi:TonB family protein
VLENQDIVVAGGSAAMVQDKALLRQVRGTLWGKPDLRFWIILILSVGMHASIVYTINHIKLPPKRTLTIEDIPERFARLIIEKPIPKELPKKQQAAIEGTAKVETVAKGAEPEVIGPSPEKKAVERKIAQKNVAARAAKVENKIRTVGVLGLLTGTGATAKGPAVVDVLGKRPGRKEHAQDLEMALQTQKGLIKTDNASILERKVVQSKDVDLLGHNAAIDDDLLSMGKTTTKDLVKTGNIVIRPPESIEGAASSNAKRDDKVIGEVVSKNKVGIKMTYEKFLKRDPNLAGKITVRFTISAAGTVTTVLILENTTGNTEFEQELIRKIKMWRFDEVPEGDVTVTYPFLFNPS